MPLPIRPAIVRRWECSPGTAIVDADRSSPLAARESYGQACAARDPNEVAADFPVPTTNVAARLVDLLLPSRPIRPGDEAA